MMDKRKALYDRLGCVNQHRSDLMLAISYIEELEKHTQALEKRNQELDASYKMLLKQHENGWNQEHHTEEHAG